MSLSLLTLAAAGTAAATVEVYKAANRTAEELLPLAEAAMAGAGSVALDSGTNSLVLMGPPAVVEEALALLRQLDEKRQTVVLRYQTKRIDELAAEKIRVKWSVGNEGIRVGNAIFPGDRTGVRASGRSGQSHREDDLTGTLRLLDGETGHIGTGRSVPVHSGGVYASSTTFVTAERGFTARPRILAPDRVQVEIAPTDDSVDDRGRVELTGATTTVIVRPGETVVLGGIARTRDDHREGSPVITATGQARDERVLLLSVDVE